jgi:hypothetical protein
MTFKAFLPNWFRSKKLTPEQREFRSRIQRPTTDDEYAVMGRPFVASAERGRQIVRPANLVRTFGGALGLAIIFGSIFGDSWILRTYGENTPGSTIDFLSLMGALAIGTVACFWILIRSERRAKAIEREELGEVTPEQREFWDRIQRPPTDEEYATVGRPVVLRAAECREARALAHVEYHTLEARLGAEILEPKWRDAACFDEDVMMARAMFHRNDEREEKLRNVVGDEMFERLLSFENGAAVAAEEVGRAVAARLRTLSQPTPA